MAPRFVAQVTSLRFEDKVSPLGYPTLEDLSLHTAAAADFKRLCDAQQTLRTSFFSTKSGRLRSGVVGGSLGSYSSS